MSYFSQLLQQQRFCILVEYLTHTMMAQPVTQIAGFPSCMTFADRVQSDDDLAPILAAKNYSNQIDKILHFAGKGRDIQDFETFLTQAKADNYHNLLLLTGDKLKRHHMGGEGERSRYLESVNAVVAAKKQGGFCVGVAFNPYKYAEAEKEAQYFKLHKKVKAGADYIITQLGYDVDALKQFKSYLTNTYFVPVLACVMPLTLARAQFMQKHQVAGIVITRHMLDVLVEEKRQGQTEHVYRRAALQILICQHLGYAGIHLSACHHPDQQKKLAEYLEQYRDFSLSMCEELWDQLWKIKTGHEFIPQMSSYSRPATSTEILKYQYLHFLHETMFNSKVAKSIGKCVFKANVWNGPLIAKALLSTEALSKYKMLGCESCGTCRLGDTLYICPETCPKGLANGACGGTSLDRCEFGDRECIHSTKARLAKAVDQTHVLKDNLIDTVSLSTRGTSSWKNWYIG